LLGALLVLLTSGLLLSAPSTRAADNPVVVENQQPGSNAWMGPSKPGNDANGQIKGYASATSVAQNGSLILYVSVNPVQTYTIDVYRMGWYQGLGGRLRLHVDQLSGMPQAPCVPDVTTGLIDCNWSPSYTLSVGGDWTSGIYIALLTNAQGYQNYVTFVVKDARPAAFLYQQSVTTYQAYNDYPDDGVSGKGLYSYNSYGANTVSGQTRAVKVSFDRPYSGDGSGQFFNWEVQFVRWMERSGYDVTYSTDLDTHSNGGALLNSKAFLSVGHDEYWSKEMRDAVEAARDRGVNLGFFGSDASFWQVRFEASAAGVANRVMVCYKDASLDPVQGPTTTVNWRNPPVNRPEQTMEGVQFTNEVPWGHNVNYVVSNSSNWVYAGSGFKDGDVVPGILGYEMDRYMADFPAPATSNEALLSQSPFIADTGAPDTANSSVYQAPSGSWVFAAGTMSWSWGLDNLGHNLADARLQKATANVFNAFLAGAPVVHDLKVAAAATVTAGQAFTVSVTAENSQSNPVVSYGGTIHFSTSDTSAGVVLPADSTLSNGQGAFAVTLATAGAQTITVSDAANSLTTTVSLNVNGTVSRLVLAPAAGPTATAGLGFSFTVTAQDQSGNVDPTYAGTVHFSSSDPSAGVVLPPDSTLTNGQATFSATLDRAGSQTINATDTANMTITGTMSMSVNAAPADHLVLATTATSTAGVAFTLSVTARDQFGNSDPSYAGTVHFSSTDSSAGVALPPDSTLTSGNGNFSATLARAGTQTITAADTVTTSISGTVRVQINPAAAATLTLSAPSSARMNQAFNVSVTLTDQFGNVATGYRGRVHFASSDPLGRMPADYTFGGSDAGTHTFSATLGTPSTIFTPSQSISVTDTANGSLSDSRSITVSAL
jgi:hypothetical protein